MKFGTLVRLKDINSVDDSFKKLKDNKLECCQLVYKPEKYTLEDAEKISASSKKYGVEITALFAGFRDSFTKWNLYSDFLDAGINSKKYGKQRVKYLKEVADFCVQLGVTDIVIHAGFVANNPFSKEYKFMLKRVIEVASYFKSKSRNLLLEMGGESPITMLRLIKDTKLDNVFVNFDTANIIMYGFGNPYDALTTLSGYVRNMHAKDGLPPITPNELGKEVEIGKGNVPFDKVIDKLKEIGYDRYIIIEREIEGEKQTSDILDALKYLNKLWNKSI